MPKGVYKHKKQSKETIQKKVDARKGYKHTDETKRKMSEARKKNPIKYWLNKKVTEEMKMKNSISKLGKKNPMYGKPSAMGMLGKKQSKETREKMSKAHKKRVKQGTHHLWKGGITPINSAIRHSIEYRLWRESVFARDNWRCKKCKKRGGELEAHHIKGFAECKELRFAIDNGMTLCKDCHKKIHNKNK